MVEPPGIDTALRRLTLSSDGVLMCILSGYVLIGNLIEKSEVVVHAILSAKPSASRPGCRYEAYATGQVRFLAATQSHGHPPFAFRSIPQSTDH